ncbi:Gti1/Pac2 family-domain-containing protein [Leucosporidium creatinivorum]|uniref:Gti1/Pac2 family-domain-containing protein n=1 Tax=Leucosporidium creatinivorum TaxID=106004 RepID=A0A1Y2G398_9BASI|nr:Gti1/Pac2 family-domain-containing protein [Leucosporidium creatinivorum]
MSADPAFRGFVETTLDALLIFEGCRRGLLPKITRRLQEFEKRALVVSGAVFVFDEEETGIKRWTDGLSWSPSRTLGNFLVYRELDKKAGTGAGGDENGMEDGLDELPTGGDPIAGPSSGRSQPASSARRRTLVGSLTSTYRFRSDGLVKKTISLAGLHMIGYYRIEDVTSGRLRTPSSHAELISLEVSSDFLSPTHFRVPPIVEIASDGHLTYKGEADAPMSPLTRSGSSQGFTTPALGGPVSWT